jgi:hypothetical protein
MIIIGKEIQFQRGMNDAANKQYTTQLQTRIFGALVKYTKKARKLCINVYTFDEWLRNKRQYNFLNSWSRTT